MKEEAHLSLAEHDAMTAPRIRVATLRDLNAIMDIEALSFSTPWSAEAMAQEIERRDWSRVIVASVEGEVAGFMVPAPTWICQWKVHFRFIGTLHSV